MPKAPQKPSDLLTLLEAADYAGLSHETLRAQIRNGKLDAKKLGRDWVVTRKEMDRYIREHRRD